MYKVQNMNSWTQSVISTLYTVSDTVNRTPLHTHANKHTYNTRTEHKKTSPKSTDKWAFPSELLKTIICSVFVAGVGGRTWRQTPVASVVVVCVCPPNVVCTTQPAEANPQTVAETGVRCSTMPSPRVLDNRSSAEAENNQKQPRLKSANTR